MYATASKGMVETKSRQSAKDDDSLSALVRRTVIWGMLSLAFLGSGVNLSNYAPAAAVMVSELRSPGQIVDDYFSNKRLYSNVNRLEPPVLRAQDQNAVISVRYTVPRPGCYDW